MIEFDLNMQYTSISSINFRTNAYRFDQRYDSMIIFNRILLSALEPKVFIEIHRMLFYREKNPARSHNVVMYCYCDSSEDHLLCLVRFYFIG